MDGPPPDGGAAAAAAEVKEEAKAMAEEAGSGAAAAEGGVAPAAEPVATASAEQPPPSAEGEAEKKKGQKRTVALHVAYVGTGYKGKAELPGPMRRMQMRRAAAVLRARPHARRQRTPGTGCSMITG